MEARCQPRCHFFDPVGTLARGSPTITSFFFRTSDLRRGPRCHLQQGYGGTWFFPGLALLWGGSPASHWPESPASWLPPHQPTFRNTLKCYENPIRISLWLHLLRSKTHFRNTKTAYHFVISLHDPSVPGTFTCQFLTAPGTSTTCLLREQQVPYQDQQPGPRPREAFFKIFKYNHF